MQSGQKLLHYHLTEKIGEGGMGVVWKATDTTLGRDVAIKILPADFADDEERLARFDREARLLASLNHPNIAGIYGIHEAEGVRFLAMELVAGEDLSRRLKSGPLPVDQAVRVVRDIATGLEAAHENGVIHRDLKPANVKLTADGTAKVLDFGLAKAADAASSASGSDPSASPTMTSAGTQAGMILGTASYMSPEQAAGQPTDRRCDIWSFGVLLHELLTGKRMFDEQTISHTLAAVLRADIDLDDLPQDTPRPLRRLIGRCVERDPARRLRDIGEARIVLEDVQAGRVDEPDPAATVDAAKAPSAAGRGRFAYLAIAILAVAAMALMALWPSPPPPAQPLVQSTLMPPAGWEYAPGSAFAVSRDGRHVAYVAASRNDNEDEPPGSSALWVRDLATAGSRRLVDADGEAHPFWSPDGQWIAFFDGSHLSKISPDGGPVVPICDATDGRGGAWSDDGTILFQPAWSSELRKVPAAGGPVEPVTTLDDSRNDLAHRWPHFLPDGRRFLFYVVSTSNPLTSEHSGIYVGSLDSDETQFLMKSESRGEYARGHVLYRAGSTLMARPFDVDDAAFTGDPTPVATEIPGGAISWGGAQFGVTDADVLVHRRGTFMTHSVLTWRDSEGTILGALDEPGDYSDPRLSRDGRRLAITIGADAADLWIYDLAQGSRTRFTFHPADDREPVWSPDDRRIAFSSARNGKGEIWEQPVSGRGEARLLYTAGTDITLNDWSIDGRWIVFSYLEQSDQSWDVWVLDTETGEAEPLLSGPAETSFAGLSPDGRWLAYTSDETGTSEIYVQRFPEADGRWMVSIEEATRGAYDPVWREDGAALYYHRRGSLVMVPVETGADFTFGTPRTLFGVQHVSGNGTRLVVMDGGQRMLVNELPPVDPSKAGARLIQNWSRMLATP